jgi:HAE1 family hydrophobic/amphiphilic exporter-1
MTSLAFILGVAPLVVATGAGAEMRQSLGTAVFGGMLGVTGFGLIFTPTFYTLVQRTGEILGRTSTTLSGPQKRKHQRPVAEAATARAPAGH